MEIQELIKIAEDHPGWFAFIVVSFIVLPFYQNVRMMFGDLVLVVLRVYPPIVRFSAWVTSDRVSNKLPVVIELPLSRVRNPSPQNDAKPLVAVYFASALLFAVMSGADEQWFSSSWWLLNVVMVGMATSFATVIVFIGRKREVKLANEGAELAGKLQFLTMIFGAEGFYYSQVLVAARTELSYKASNRDIAATMLTTFSAENLLAKNLFSTAENLMNELESLKVVRRVRGRIVDSSFPEYFRLTRLGARAAAILVERDGDPLKVKIEPDGVRFTVP